MENITDGDYTQFVNVLKQENNTMIFMFNVRHYCQQMYLRALERCPAKFFLAPGLAWQAVLKRLN